MGSLALSSECLAVFDECSSWYFHKLLRVAPGARAQQVVFVSVSFCCSHKTPQAECLISRSLLLTVLEVEV